MAGLSTESMGAEPPARRPPGITVHDTPAGQVFADADGLTLYVFDGDTEPGVSNCTGDCATAWPPVLASADASAFDDWTLVPRTGGARQWAYKGKPLYRYAEELTPGWALGDGGGSWNLALTSWVFLKRNTGRAAGGPPPEPPLDVPPVPAGVSGLRTSLGPVLADHQSRTLYTFDKSAAPGPATQDPADCARPCTAKWRPLLAPMAALPFADWSIVAGFDGNRQWAFKDKPVYTCNDDVTLGDVNCELGAGGAWRAMKF